MVPGFPQVGGMELLILLAIILLFFGAKRVPELGRSLGKGIREFRKGTAEVGDDGKDRVQEGDGGKPSLNGAAHGGLPRTEEVGTTRGAEQKS